MPNIIYPPSRLYKSIYCNECNNKWWWSHSWLLRWCFDGGDGKMLHINANKMQWKIKYLSHPVLRNSIRTKKKHTHYVYRVFHKPAFTLERAFACNKYGTKHVKRNQTNKIGFLQRTKLLNCSDDVLMQNKISLCKWVKIGLKFHTIEIKVAHAHVWWSIQKIAVLCRSDHFCDFVFPKRKNGNHPQNCRKFLRVRV